MVRTHSPWRCLAASAAMAAFVAGVSLAQPVGPFAAATAPAPAVLPLPPSAHIVIVDAETEVVLAEADRLVRRKDLSGAVETLHELMLARREGFIPTTQAGLLASVPAAAAARLEALGPEALAVYRNLYETTAKALYDKALAAGDVNALRTLMRQYALTVSAQRAQATLASLHFNRGEFGAAAAAWRDALEANSPAASAAELMARIALAYGLAGEADLSRQWLGRLKAEHGGAKGVIAAKEQDLAAFVETTLAAAPAAASAPAEPALPAAGRLTHAWQYRGKPLNDAMDANLSFIALQEWLSYIHGSIQLIDGHVFYSPPNGPAISPMVQPQLRSGLLLVRDDEGLAALDPAGGEVKWKTPLPMIRTIPELAEYFSQVQVKPDRTIQMPATQVASEGNAITTPTTSFTIPGYKLRANFRHGVSEFHEDFRNTLSADDNVAYVVGGFVTSSHFPPQAAPGEQAPHADKLKPDSYLAAVSLQQQGKVLWTIGQGQGDDALTQAACYVVPPAVAGNRLYAITIHQGQYVLAALDAANGGLVWKSTFAAAGRRWVKASGNGEVAGSVRDWACPPMVTGDRVIVSCAGVVAAFDAVTGTPLWAYEYPPEKPTASGIPAGPRRAGEVNPLVVCGDEVVCLPADCSNVFAVAMQDGKLRWRRDADGLWNLARIDDRRVLLSGRDSGRQDIQRARSAEVNRRIAEINKEAATNPSAAQEKLQEILKLQSAPMEGLPAATVLEVVSAADGNAVYSLPSAAPLIGRAAIAGRCLLACGEGQILRIDLADYKVDRLPLAAPAALGNLLLRNGKLYAANALGLWAYEVKDGSGQ